MSEESAAKINRAVRDCLRQCYLHDSPLTVIAHCTEGLRKQPDWTEAEINQVQSTVLKMLRSLLQPPDDPDLPPEEPV